MRWFDVKRSIGRGIGPSGFRATAWKNKSVSATPIEHGNFQIGIKRRNRNRQPFVRWPLMLKHDEISNGQVAHHLDLNQGRTLVDNRPCILC